MEYEYEQDDKELIYYDEEYNDYDDEEIGDEESFLDKYRNNYEIDEEQSQFTAAEIKGRELFEEFLKYNKINVQDLKFDEYRFTSWDATFFSEKT